MALSIAGVDNNNYGVVTRLDVGCIYSASSTVDVYVDSAVVSRSYIGPAGPVIEYTLNVAVAPVGSGSVTKNPDQASYPSGTVITLSAVPASGYKFVGWSGDVVSTDNPVQVTMNGDKDVTATFVESTYLFEDGFESGGFNAWTGTSGSPVVQSAVTVLLVVMLCVLLRQVRASYLNVAESDC